MCLIGHIYLYFNYGFLKEAIAFEKKINLPGTREAYPLLFSL
jgi:hypothetical protein